MGKKGLAEIIIIILLILLVIMAVLILIAYLKPVVQKSAEDIKSGVSCFDVSLRITEVGVIDRSGETPPKSNSYLVKFQREAGGGEIAKLIFIVYGEENKKYVTPGYKGQVISSVSEFDELESGVWLIPAIESNEETRVSIAPVLDIDGKEKICPEQDFHNIGDETEPDDDLEPFIDDDGGG